MGREEFRKDPSASEDESVLRLLAFISANNSTLGIKVNKRNGTCLPLQRHEGMGDPGIV